MRKTSLTFKILWRWIISSDRKVGKRSDYKLTGSHLPLLNIFTWVAHHCYTTLSQGHLSILYRVDPSTSNLQPQSSIV